MNTVASNNKSIPSDETRFWKKKETISWFLSILIYLIHISTFASYPNVGTTMSKINEGVAFFFKESITRYAVPMFFILSGMAFFKNYENKVYFKKLKSRCRSLLVPFIIWNTLWLLFEIVCASTFIASYINREPIVLSVKNVLKGFFFYEYNPPFWFIFDLFVFTLLAPIIYTMIKNKFVGLSTVILSSILLNFNIGLPESVFFSSSSIVYYLIGAIIGKHYLSYFTKKSSSKLQLASLSFLIAYICIKNILHILDILPEDPSLNVLIYVMCSFAIWNIFDLFVERIKNRSIYKTSFAMYAMHINVSATITRLLFFLLPKYEWCAIPNFIITIVLTTTIIYSFCIILNRISPSLYSLLMGRKLKS